MQVKTSFLRAPAFPETLFALSKTRISQPYSATAACSGSFGKDDSINLPADPRAIEVTAHNARGDSPCSGPDWYQYTEDPSKRSCPRSRSGQSPPKHLGALSQSGDTRLARLLVKRDLRLAVRPYSSWSLSSRSHLRALH